MFCKKCGNPLQDGSRFCPKCGASMQNDTNPFVSPFPEENVGTSMQMPQEMAVPESGAEKLLGLLEFPVPVCCCLPQPD